MLFGFDIHHFFTAKYAKWLTTGLIVFFSLLITFQWSTLLLRPKINLPKEKEINNSPSRKEEGLNDLFQVPLFGVYVSKNLNEKNIKKSRLNVTLVGILFNRQERRSQVIIRSVQGQEKIFKLGDEIPGGATIKRIMANSVWVERDGQLESLSLPKNNLTFEPIAKPLRGA